MPFYSYAADTGQTAELAATANLAVSTEKPQIAPSSIINNVGNKVWTEFTAALKNASLSKSFNAPTEAITKGLSIGGGLSLTSSPSIGGKYSGIDVWNVNVSASPEIFGIVNNSSIGIGASTSRQFTFIQQFEDRNSSVIRVPYDPVTKIPIKSEMFFKTKTNRSTGLEEPVIKDGDFIGYRAPLTISVGTGFSSIASHFGVNSNLYWVVSGEFDIHIFKMKNNMVRVKIIAIKDNTRGASAGLNLMGFNPIGNMVISKFIDTNLLQFNTSATKSDFFIADYIFNLNKTESRDMYDNVLGHKMKSLDLESISTQLKTANPLASDGTTQKRLVADLDRVNEVSTADQKLPTAERRIIRVSSGKNITDSNSFAMSLNLFKVVKANSTTTKSISKATIYAQDNHLVNSKYLLETSSNNKSYDWFWLWGEKDLKTTSLLLNTDDNFVPTNLLGYQISRVKEDMSMSKVEFDDIKNSFMQILPTAISSFIKWPQWNFGTKNSVNNVYVQQEVLFTEGLFKSNVQVTEEKIRQELILIIKHYGKFRSMPMSLQPESSEGQLQDPRKIAYQRGDYINAFDKDWEQTVIPNKLSIVLNSQYSIAERYKAYAELNQDVPLFAEINAALLLRIFPAEELSKVAIAKLIMSGRNQDSIEAYFPSKEEYNKSNVFREVTYQTQYILNRSFDLRNFIKEDGTIYSADEILDQRTKK